MAVAPLTFNTSQTAILMADFHREWGWATIPWYDGIVATRSPYSEKTLWMSRSLFPMIWPTIYRKNGGTIFPAGLWKAWLLKRTGNGLSVNHDFSDG